MSVTISGMAWSLIIGVMRREIMIVFIIINVVVVVKKIKQFRHDTSRGLWSPGLEHGSVKVVGS